MLEKVLGRTILRGMAEGDVELGEEELGAWARRGDKVRDSTPDAHGEDGGGCKDMREEEKACGRAAARSTES
jgi:hypothetical protein